MPTIRINHGALLTALDAAKTLLGSRRMISYNAGTATTGSLNACTIEDGPDGVQFTAYEGDEWLHYQLDPISDTDEPATVTVDRLELDRATRALAKGITRRTLAGRFLELDQDADKPATLIERNNDGGGVQIPVGLAHMPADRREGHPTCDGLTFDTDDLRRALNQAAVSVGTDQTLPILSQALVESDRAGHCQVVTTDRFRLTVAPVATTVKPDHECSVKLPLSVLRTIAKHAPGAETTVSPLDFGGAASMVSIQSGPLSITATSDVEFVKYQVVIDYNFETVALLNRAQMVSAVEKVMALKTRDFNPCIRLTLAGEGAAIDYRNFNAGDETWQHLGDVTGSDIPKVRTQRALMANYLLDALRIFDSPEIAIGWRKKLGPISFAPKGEALAALPLCELRHLVMPIKLAEEGGQP